MIFSNATRANVNLSINQTETEIVTVTTFLAVLVDDKLTWEQHISSLGRKLAKFTRIICNASQLSQSSKFVPLYYTLFLSYISYWAETKGNACNTNI